MKKVFQMALLIIGTVFAYILFAFMIPVNVAINEQVITDLNASANMSHFPGTVSFIGSSPVWFWFIPGVVAIVWAVIILKK